MGHEIHEKTISWVMKMNVWEVTDFMGHETPPNVFNGHYFFS